MSTVAPINFPVLNLPIPTAWTNALSYMEMIGKLVNKVNELIDLVNTVVESSPIDYNLQQINQKINTLNTIVGTANYTSEYSLNSRVAENAGNIDGIHDIIGTPYTSLQTVNARLGSLESAVGIPYNNTTNLNVRVTSLEFAQGGENNG